MIILQVDFRKCFNLLIFERLKIFNVLSQVLTIYDCFWLTNDALHNLAAEKNNFVISIQT